MNADRVKVLHVTNGNHVALCVAHYLIFNFLPAGNALFNQHLMNGGKTQAVRADFAQLLGIVTNAAAGAAHGKGRAHDNRVADFLGKAQSILQRFHYFRRNNRLVQLLHRVFKELTVLRTVNGVGAAAQKTHTLLFQKAAAVQLHRQV